MSMLTRLAASGGTIPKTFADDVFSTFLYSGNQATQVITNGLNLSGKGGMLWIKSRTGTRDNYVFDSVRELQFMRTNSVNGSSTGLTWSGFNTFGFTLGAEAAINAAEEPFASWCFRRAPNFFDVVTWTGDNTTRAISHGLGVTPGIIVVKRTDTASTQGWVVWHTSTGGTNNLLLNGTAAAAVLVNGSISAATSTTFTVQAGSTNTNDVNAVGGTYIAYLFAHDTGADGLIQCGSYTGNGSATGPIVTLNWEPQWLLIKRASGGTGGWNVVDSMRGLTVTGQNDAYLVADTTATEALADWVSPTSTGFKITSTSTEINNNTDTYIYVAIRRSNKPPTTGTQVFQPTVYTGTNVDNQFLNTTIAPDMVWLRQRNGSGTGHEGFLVGFRARGQGWRKTGSITAEQTPADGLDQQLVSSTEYGTAFSAMDGIWIGNNSGALATAANINANTTVNNHTALAFKRASRFMDIIEYSGNGGTQTINHNLGTQPAVLISFASNLSKEVFYQFSPGDSMLYTVGFLNTTSTGSGNFSGATASQLNFTSSNLNNIGTNYITVLFALLDGVTRSGQYTGNGGSLIINCGFAAGARLVIIKRLDNTGDWHIFNTATGIVSGNDPYLRTNGTNAEVTTNDSIDPDNSGFLVNQDSTTNININAAIYFYLAIA